jgi:hypothetical protein
VLQRCTKILEQHEKKLQGLYASLYVPQSVTKKKFYQIRNQVAIPPFELKKISLSLTTKTREKNAKKT